MDYNPFKEIRVLLLIILIGLIGWKVHSIEEYLEDTQQVEIGYFSYEFKENPKL